MPVLVMEDLLNELYTLDNKCWYENTSNILKILNFPVQFEYMCLWEEFLHVRLEKFRLTNVQDRNALAKCKTIVSYSMERRLRRMKLFVIHIEEGTRNQNDTVYEITNLFKKIYGRFIILVFADADEVAFSGIAINNNKSETIISEWFGYNKDCELNEKILEIDFTSFRGNDVNEIYSDYLWSIARSYVKYRESEIQLIYGCENPVIDEVFVLDQDGDRAILITKIDREETLRINSSYYPEMYGEDYFLDDAYADEELLDLLSDEEDIDFEWAMLEMELANEVEEEESDDYVTDEGDEEFYDTELIDMNPEEMLRYINRGQ